MNELRVQSVGTPEEFRFTLSGPLDARGAITLDRLLSGCRERGAQEVLLDFTAVSALCPLGGGVLARQGRMYEDARRRIIVKGLRGPARDAIAAIGVVADPSDPARTAAPAPGLTLLLTDASAAEPSGRGREPHGGGQDEASSPTRRPRACDPTTPQGATWTAPCMEADGALTELQTQLKRKILQFRNLFDTTSALNLASDLDDVLGLFALSVMGQFGMERLAVFLADREREGALTPRYVRGFPPEHFQGLALPPGFIAARAGERSLFEIRVGPGDDSGEVAELLVSSGFAWGGALRAQRDLEGVLLLGGSEGRRPLLEEEQELLTILIHQAAVAIANARIRREQDERNLGLVRGMMALIESRDPYERGSTERVVRLVHATARAMQFPRASLQHLNYGSVLRDIGMIATGGLNLKSPARLSEHEWALIRQHPARGAQILEEMNFPREVVEIVLNHHERWGGEGYPGGIRGSEIPLAARIVSIADAYVSMTSDRPYRRALPRDRARQVIAENWGTPFDPEIVDVFLRILARVERRSQRMPSTAEPGSRDAAHARRTSGEGSRVELDPYGAGATIPLEGSR